MSTESIDSDPVFQQGLESILAPLKARGASNDEIESVTAQARSFYLSTQQQQASISQASDRSPQNDVVVSSSLGNDDQGEDDDTARRKATEAPYPSSFASLAALIASGQPIPGIKEIPDKLAEGEPSESKVDVAAQGKKPWEKVTNTSEPSATT